MSRAARYTVKSDRQYPAGEPLAEPTRKSGAEPQLQSFRQLSEVPESRPTTTQGRGTTPEEQIVDVFNNPIGIYGWRKYCLYATVLILLCLAIINIGLAVYIMRVADINSHGAGAARFESGLVRIEGVAEITEGLYANNVTSFEENSLALLSTKQIVLQSNQTTAVTLADGTADFRVDRFQASYNGSAYLSASPAQTTISSTKTFVASPAGMVVEGSVQTARIANMHSNGAGLTLESLAQSLTMQAAQNVTITATDGAVAVSALTGITLSSATSLTLSAPVITLEGLPTFGAPGPFALCVCETGALFRVGTNSSCLTASAAACP